MASKSPNKAGLLRSGAVFGAAAATATTTLAAIARVAGVSLTVDETAIPIAAFALWTLIGAALGMALARLLPTRRAFIIVTAGLTTLTLVPAAAAPDDAATAVVLVAAHILAAVIVIPALSQQVQSADLDAQPAATSKPSSGGS